MEYRQLGKAGLHVPALSFGTATFGGGNEFFKAWGNTDVKGAKKDANKLIAVPMKDFGLHAKRPIYSALKTQNGIPFPSLEKALDNCYNGKMPA
jgi:hypothetical protein